MEFINNKQKKLMEKNIKQEKNIEKVQQNRMKELYIQKNLIFGNKLNLKKQKKNIFQNIKQKSIKTEKLEQKLVSRKTIENVNIIDKINEKKPIKIESNKKIKELKEVKKTSEKNIKYNNLNNKYKIWNFLDNDNWLNIKRLEFREKMKLLKKQTDTNINNDYQNDDEEVYLKDYNILKDLGKGSYAVVKLAEEISTKKKFAIKIYEKIKISNTIKKKNLNNEIEILKEVDHPNIIKIIKNIEARRHYYIIMEYMSSVSLYDYIKTNDISYEDKKLIIYQIIDGMNYLHKKYIIHRDLKLENILINDKKIIKIIDFGFTIKVNPNKFLKLFCGTPSFMAPEIVSRKRYKGIMADIWSFGICIFKILTGNFPFFSKIERELFIKIKLGKFEIPKNLAVDAKNLIKKILVLNPEKRLTAEEIINHKFFKKSKLKEIQSTVHNSKDIN